MKLNCDKLLSNFAFKINLCRYSKVSGNSGNYNPVRGTGNSAMCCAFSKMKVRKGLQNDINAWCKDDSDRISAPPRGPPPPNPPPPSPPPSDWCSHHADGTGCAVGTKVGRCRLTVSNPVLKSPGTGL